MTGFIVLLSVVADQLLGEPGYLHPLVGFGRLAKFIEELCYRFVAATNNVIVQRLVGSVALILAVAPLVALSCLINRSTWVGFTASIAVLYLTIGAKSLSQHAQAVMTALEKQDLPAARTKVGWIVSRDTKDMSATDVARATIESVLENGSDAIFGAVFWFVLLGAPGAVMYRLVNTLDAMWGYKTERYLHFGWAAARFDDLLNYVPARLTALSYAITGNFINAWRCWREQSRTWYSPNAGPVMAAGAGALVLELGGPARYHGSMKERPTLGSGAAPGSQDIARAINLVKRALLLWIIFLVIGGFALHA